MGVNEFIQVGTRMKNFRQKQKMTQREVASKLSIPYSTYSNYENNNREPSFEVIKKVAVILGVSVSDLMDWDNMCDAPRLAREVELLEHAAQIGGSTYEMNLAFARLNEVGQKKVIAYIKDLLQIDIYCLDEGQVDK